MTHFRRHILSLLLALASVMFFAVGPVNGQSISLTTTTYTQDFNSQASSGISSVVPNGWYFSEGRTDAIGTYSDETGSGHSGNTYSFWNSKSINVFSNNGAVSITVAWYQLPIKRHHIR